MNDYVSTAPIYDSNYLVHARQYSHKYISRTGTPGHYVYTYPTDFHGQSRAGGSSKFQGYLLTSRDRVADAGEKIGTFKNVSYGDGRNRYRQFDKAGQIYKEGEKSTESDRVNKLTGDLRKVLLQNQAYENTLKASRDGYNHTNKLKSQRLNQNEYFDKDNPLYNTRIQENIDKAQQDGVSRTNLERSRQRRQAMNESVQSPVTKVINNVSETVNQTISKGRNLLNKIFG